MLPSFGNNKNVDEFEELLSKLNSLSFREIQLLYLLHNEEEKIKQVNNKEEVFNPKKSWEAFINKADPDYKKLLKKMND